MTEQVIILTVYTKTQTNDLHQSSQRIHIVVKAFYKLNSNEVMKVRIILEALHLYYQHLVIFWQFLSEDTTAPLKMSLKFSSKKFIH